MTHRIGSISPLTCPILEEKPEEVCLQLSGWHAAGPGYPPAPDTPRGLLTHRTLAGYRSPRLAGSAPSFHQYLPPTEPEESRPSFPLPAGDAIWELAVCQSLAGYLWLAAVLCPQAEGAVCRPCGAAHRKGHASSSGQMLRVQCSPRTRGQE